RDAALIYNKLSKLELISPTNYSYSALANQRLNNLTTAFEIFEKGIKAYPEDNSLKSLYIQVCAAQHNYTRYSEFMQQLLGSGDDSVISLVNFYKNLNGETLLYLLINFKYIEKNCVPTDSEILKQHFLVDLARNRVSLQTAK